MGYSVQRSEQGKRRKKSSQFGIVDSRFHTRNGQTFDEPVKEEISETNAIRVTDESASGYNTAIVELLNRFGITP